MPERCGLTVGARRLSVMSEHVRPPLLGIQPACRLLVFICMVFCAGQILTVPVLGQQVWVRAYESVEDLWESYVEGEISEEQYQQLVELFRAGADSVFRPLWNLEELPGYSVLDSVTDVAFRGSEARRSVTGGSVRHNVRWGYTLPVREGADEEGYLIVSRQSDRLNFLIEGQSRDGTIGGLRRRGITYNHPRSNFRITLGNFESRYGLGLIVGRRDRVLGRTELTRLSGSVWQAQHGKYNGIFLQLDPMERFHLGVFGSRIENARYREDIGAMHFGLSRREGKSQFGLTVAGGVISNRVDQPRLGRYGVGIFASSEKEAQKVEAEAGISGGASVAGAIRAVRTIGKGQCSLTLWSYDPDFIVFSSGGPGHPGRCRIGILGDELDYYSRTTGEQGFLLVQRIPAGARTTIESAFEVFNERLEKTKNLEGKVSCRVRAARHISITGYFRGGESHGRNHNDNRLYFGCSGDARLPGDRPTKWRFEYGLLYKESNGKSKSLRFEFQTIIAVNRFMRFTPRFRYIDPDLSASGDGYSYLYITENIPFAPNSELEIVAVVKGYEDSGKSTFADVRVRVSWRL